MVAISKMAYINLPLIHKYFAVHIDIKMIYECFKHLSTCTSSTDYCKHTKMNVNIKCYEQSEMAAIMDFSNFIKNNNNNGINLFIEGSFISPQAMSSLRELFDASSYRRMASLIRTRQSDLGTDHLISRGGGGWDFSLRQVIFFSLFVQQVFFSKGNCNKFFLYFKKYHIKSEKCKRKQHIE